MSLSWSHTPGTPRIKVPTRQEIWSLLVQDKAFCQWFSRLLTILKQDPNCYYPSGYPRKSVNEIIIHIMGMGNKLLANLPGVDPDSSKSFISVSLSNCKTRMMITIEKLAHRDSWRPGHCNPNFRETGLRTLCILSLYKGDNSVTIHEKCVCKDDDDVLIGTTKSEDFNSDGISVKDPWKYKTNQNGNIMVPGMFTISMLIQLKELDEWSPLIHSIFDEQFKEKIWMLFVCNSLITSRLPIELLLIICSITASLN